MESGSQFSHYAWVIGRAWSQASTSVIMAWVIGREHGVRLALQLLWHGLLIACWKKLHCLYLPWQRWLKKIALSIFTLTEMTGTPSTEPSARGEDLQAHNSHSHRKGGTASARQRYRKAKSWCWAFMSGLPLNQELRDVKCLWMWTVKAEVGVKCLWMACSGSNGRIIIIGCLLVLHVCWLMLFRRYKCVTVTIFYWLLDVIQHQMYVWYSG